MESTGKPNSASTAFTADMSESLVFSMRSTESTRPTTSTFASALSLGMTSRTAVPAVITSSTSSTFMPSVSGVPTIQPPSPWSFFSLRSKVYPTVMLWPAVSAIAVDTASGMPL